MMREFFKARMGLAVLAGLGLSSLAATSADAALLTMELRPTSATTVAPGGVVTFDIYAVVANGDGNKANDNWSFVNMGYTSVDSGALGNIAPVTFSSNAQVPSTPGTPINYDANPDLELGGADPNVAGGWNFLTSGLAPITGTGTTGNLEILLGSTSWTSDGVSTGSTLVNTFHRVRTTQSGLNATVKYQSDGVAHSEHGNDADVGVGAPTLITVTPEPAALGLLGLGALAAVRRRRA